MRISTRLLSLGLAAGALAGCLWAPTVGAQASGEVQVRLGDAPPPPAVVFRKEPEVILIPQSRVYYVPQLKYDLFRYGRYWYINNQGYWYRARSYRGPFTNVDQNRIPRSITRVPSKYHKHPLARPTGGSTITRGVGDAVKEIVRTRDQPSQGVGKRKSAVTRPSTGQPTTTRKAWERTKRSPSVKKRPPATTVKKPSRSATKKPAASSVKKPSRSGSKKPAASVEKPSRSGSKKPAASSVKKTSKKKATPKKSAPQKKKK
jgi:hypothetical protein